MRRRDLASVRLCLTRWPIAAMLKWHADCCSTGMAKAPGYQKNPNHRIQTTPVEQSVRVFVRAELVAESNDVLRVDEDGHPPRYYFPLLAVHTDLLERTQTQTRCPFKGTASYFTLRVAGDPLTDAIWSYEDPYEEHQILKGRLAFYTEKFPEISIRLG
jgi:uncharacterized protein (DUF427 family)